MVKQISIFATAIILSTIILASCSTSKNNNKMSDLKISKMIKVSFFYKQQEGGKLDLDYFVNKHMPLAIEKQRSLGLLSFEIEKGISGGSPEAEIPYIAVAHIGFESVEKFQKSFAEVGDELMADVANFTNIQPIVQISEVKANENIQDETDKHKIKISFYYAEKKNGKLDMDYFINKHMQLAIKRQRDLGLQTFEIKKGIAGGTPKAKVPYISIAHIGFESVEKFQNSFATVGEELMADVENFTNIQPTMQVSEILAKEIVK